MEVGKIIKEKRSEKNMTQEDLANEFFVSRQLISKWENGKSYPDLEQLLKLSDFFDLTLDELMRGDKKMTNKLNFGIKKKRILLFLAVLSTFFIIIVVNFFVSTISFNPAPQDLEVSRLKIYRNESYDGSDFKQDWNSVILANVKSKNIFFKPVADSFLVKANENNLSGHIKWSFSLFNIFSNWSSVLVEQTVLIDPSISEMTFDLNDSKKEVPVNIN